MLILMLMLIIGIIYFSIFLLLSLFLFQMGSCFSSEHDHEAKQPVTIRWSEFVETSRLFQLYAVTYYAEARNHSTTTISKPLSKKYNQLLYPKWQPVSIAAHRCFVEFHPDLHVSSVNTVQIPWSMARSFVRAVENIDREYARFGYKQHGLVELVDPKFMNLLYLSLVQLQIKIAEMGEQQLDKNHNDEVFEDDHL